MVLELDIDIDEMRDKLVNGDKISLEEVESYGGTNKLNSAENPLEANKIIQGDNLEVLKTLIKSKKYNENVKLIYIDPPFAADHDFEFKGNGRDDPTYKDKFGNDEYLRFMAKRLVLLRELLSEDGSIYVHIGEEKVAEMKILMDNIFGPKNYMNMISRRKCHSKNQTKRRYGNVQDFILFYSKSDKVDFERPEREPTEEEKKRKMKEYRYKEEETGRRYMKVPIYAQGERDGVTGGEWNGMKPPEGKHWITKPENLDKLEEEGKIVWSDNGNPRKKVYYDENKGIPATDMWQNLRDYYNQQQSITGYPTEKNKDLLKRIIQASSQEGEIVMDAFMGSGTTLAAADELGREWVGIDRNEEAIEVATERLSDEKFSPFKQYRLSVE